jgi:hypothetical protein
LISFFSFWLFCVLPNMAVPPATCWD